MRRLLLATALLAGQSAFAAEGGKLSVELNDLQQADSGCRAVFVLNNGIGKPLEALTLRVVGFDKESHAGLFLSLDVGALPAGKTRVLRFDLGEKTNCDNVSRMVLDDVTDCKGADMSPAACLAAITLSSRAKAPLDF
jgi:hypothetical protein